MSDTGVSGEFARASKEKTSEMSLGNKLAALLFVSVTALAAVGISRLEFGTLALPGPALFPSAAAALLAALSLLLAIQRSNSTTGAPFFWRPVLAISLAALIFAGGIEGFRWQGTAFMLPALGMPAAGTLAMLASGLAGHHTHWGKLAAVSAVTPLVFACVLRFALGQAIPIAPWWLGY